MRKVDTEFSLKEKQPVKRKKYSIEFKKEAARLLIIDGLSCQWSLQNRPVVVTSKPATLRSAVSRCREVGMQGWNGKAERAGPVGAKRRRARRREVQRSGRFPALGGGGRGVGVYGV